MFSKIVGHNSGVAQTRLWRTNKSKPNMREVYFALLSA